MTLNAMFSSRRQNWSTPQALFDRLDHEFHFEVDVCASPRNAKCETFYETDGLSQDWRGVCWCNPPYLYVEAWLRKAWHSVRRLDGATTVVCLVPARTDTEWWHHYVMRASEVRFVRGRLKFGRAEHNAPFPSALVVFRPGEWFGPPVIGSYPEEPS